MNRLIAVVLLAMCAQGVSVTAGAATPALFAVQRFGGAGTESCRGVAIDASGNIVIVGDFTGTADFGGGPLTSAGGSDVVVMSYTASGVHRWSQRFGSTNNETAGGVAVDAAGNIIVAGQFTGTVAFGGIPLNGTNDVFLAKYDRSGVHQWSQVFAGFLGTTETARGVAVDPSGNVFVCVRWLDNIGTDTCSGEGLPAMNFRVYKLTPTGSLLWNVCPRFNNSGGNDLVFEVDQSGNLFLTGAFFSFLTIAGQNYVSAGGSDIFLAKYNSSGTAQWASRFGQASSESGRGIAIDESGNILLTGAFFSTLDMGGGAMVTAGNNDIFLCQLDPSGLFQWNQRFGGVSGDVGAAVRVGNGQITLAGSVFGTADLGGDPVGSDGVSSVFVARYESNGSHVWSHALTGITLTGFTGDTTGKYALASTFSGNVLVNGGQTQSAGSSDMLVARYALEPAEPTITVVNDIGNDQGRRVKIRFTRSGYDNVGATLPIRRYDVFRRDDPPPSTSPQAATVRADGWTQVGTISPYGETTYGVDAPTIGDSTNALGQYLSVFSIRAATDNPAVFFASPSASGYSLDNLAPGVPQNLTYSAGLLTWGESTDADFDFFTVYGNNTNSFATATLLGHTVAPEKDTTASSYAYYFATATDFAGNEGKPASLKALSGTDGIPRSYALSVTAYPNPFNPETTIRYTLPSRAHVVLTIYDARGSRVRTLMDGEHADGQFTVRWDGKTDAGEVVGSGVYFVRLRSGNERRSYKLVLQK